MMEVIEQTMLGVWGIYDTTMVFPPPIGAITPGDILLFFAAGYLLADTIGGVSERRD